MLKLTRLEGGREFPAEWPHVFARQRTTGPDRLVIAPREEPLDVLCSLARFTGPEYFLLYVLLTPRGSTKSGRYQSPPLKLEGIEGFIEEFRRCLTEDARHQLWIGSTEGRGTLVYEEHGLIYAYGPLEKFERSLIERGLRPGTFEIPSPHSHHFHLAYDADVEELLDRWEWKRTELQPGDSG